MPYLVIRREVGWERKPTTYRIFVDDEEKGTIQQGQQVKVEVQPGHHGVQFRLGRLASETLELMVVPNKDELLECGHETKAVPAFFGRLLAPKSFIRAKRRGTGFGSKED
ncbi:MAG TPA: hypothetical protein VFF16_07745 [Telluria sp.]|nr:hypothetical protein [Telluria sp.]